MHRADSPLHMKFSIIQFWANHKLPMFCLCQAHMRYSIHICWVNWFQRKLIYVTCIPVCIIEIMPATSTWLQNDSSCTALFRPGRWAVLFHGLYALMPTSHLLSAPQTFKPTLSSVLPKTPGTYCISVICHLYFEKIASPKTLWNF